MLAGNRVPAHDLVVVAGRHERAVWELGKTPDLAVGVRAHDVGLGARGVDGGDGTIALADHKVAGGVAVNSADKAIELDGVGDGVGAGVNAVDLAILGAREELAIGEAHGADEALAMEVEGLLAGAAVVATPDVDEGVGATGVALARVVPGNAGEGGLVVFAEETLLLAGGVLAVPEVDVLDTGRGESGGARGGVPADVVDLVGVTLLLELGVAVVVEAVDLVFVVEVHGADPAFSVDGNGGDATGALCYLDAVLLLAGACVPGEDGR